MMTPPLLTYLATRAAVEDAVVTMFVSTDERDWATLARCFTDPFTLDMTSMVGGAPATMTPTQVCEAWKAGFAPLDHVHHQIGNLRTRVAGTAATVKCHGVALHHRKAAPGPKTRLFVGTYELDLTLENDAWRIHRLVFLLKFIDGNTTLESDAQSHLG